MVFFKFYLNWISINYTIIFEILMIFQIQSLNIESILIKLTLFYNEIFFEIFATITFMSLNLKWYFNSKIY